MQSLRMRALVARRTTFGPVAEQQGKPEPTSVGPCWFEPAAPHQTPRFDRDRLPANCRVTGPAIVEQMDTTTVVPPRAKLHNDQLGYLHLTLEPLRIKGGA